MYVIRSKEIQFSDSAVTGGDRAALAEWIAAGGSLTRGVETAQFEREIADWLGVRHAVMVNSGASANLVLAYALKQGGLLRNLRAIVPALCRPTTIAPLIQLGFQISLCDCDPQTLNIDLDQLETLLQDQSPAVLMLPHVLGVPCDMEAIQTLCEQYQVILLEDAREALGSVVCGRKVGTFGTAASFSLRDGYQLSTVEGGLVVTDDTDLHQMALSLRDYGMRVIQGTDRRARLCDRLGHTGPQVHPGFLNAGFGLNGSEINAFLGRRKIHQLDASTARRDRNRSILSQALDGFFTQFSPGDATSCTGFGTLVRNRDEVVEFLRQNRVASRAMIAPNIARLPFWYAQHGAQPMPEADQIHETGLCLPVHAGLDEMQMVRIADLVAKIADPV